jgi:flagellin-like hook-associated protein FlgL
MTGINFSVSTTIGVEVTIGAMTSSGGIQLANNLVYNLQAGDFGTGSTILTGYVTGGVGWDGYTALKGLVFVDSTFQTAMTGYLISGTKIYFTTGFAPTNGTVTYLYSSGMSAAATTGARSNQLSVFTGQVLNANQTIDTVAINGVVQTTGYNVSGNVISLNSALAAGAHMTYKVTTTTDGGWKSDSGIDDTVNQLNTAIETLRTQSASLASNLNIVTIRQDFTDAMIQTLQKGSDNLTLADMNEEGANMLMLQTRQQLGTTSLKMASDAAQSVLRLF